jgi:hypothetical protein
VYNNGECKLMFLRLMLRSHSNQPLLLVVSIVLVASIVVLLLDPSGLLLFRGITKSRIILFIKSTTLLLDLFKKQYSIHDDLDFNLWRVRSLVYSSCGCELLLLLRVLMSHSNQQLLLVVSVASIVLLLLDPSGLLLFRCIT